MEENDLDIAYQSLDVSRVLYQKRVLEDDSETNRKALFNTHTVLGDVLCEMPDLPGALKEYESALELARSFYPPKSYSLVSPIFQVLSIRSNENILHEAIELVEETTEIVKVEQAKGESSKAKDIEDIMLVLFI